MCTSSAQPRWNALSAPVAPRLTRSTSRARRWGRCLTYLRELRVAPTPPPPPRDGPVEVALERYRHYLTAERAFGERQPGPTSTRCDPSCAAGSHPTAAIWTSRS